MTRHKGLNQAEPRSGGTLFTSFCRKIPRISYDCNADGLYGKYQSVGEFEESLTLQLESLKSEKDEGLLCLGWLEHALIMVLEKHEIAESLIRDLQLPLSESDKKWMEDYLDETIKILDMCNTFTARMSTLEHSQLLVLYAIHMLEKPIDSLGREDMQHARDSLCNWQKSIALQSEKFSVTTKSVPWHVSLQSMVHSLKPPKEKNAMKLKEFLHAFYGAKVATLMVCIVLAMALSQDDILMLKLHLSDQFLLSTFIINLLKHVKEEAKERISMGSVTCLLELDNADKSVRKLLSVLDAILENSLTFELAERLVLSVQDVRSSIYFLGEGIDKVGKKIHEFFHMIVHSRSILLEHLFSSCKADNI